MSNTTSTPNIDDMWLHRAAVAIHDAERGLALVGLRQTPRFQAELKRLQRLHQEIIDGLGGIFNETSSMGQRDIAVAGAWMAPVYWEGRCSPPAKIVSLPSDDTHPTVEAALSELGTLLGGTTRALTVSAGRWGLGTQIVWHDEDVELLDITLDEALVQLFERLRWEDDPIIVQRFREISDALRTGGIPAPPTYVWPAERRRSPKQ